MANFSSLKQAIQNYIKENGNKEITGNLLQNIMLSMVTTMGDGAINDNASDISDIQNEIQNITTRLNIGASYAGYATPSTTPVALTGQEVFYLATQAGTYTNFHFNGGDDPIVLTKDGIYFIVSGDDDDDWNAEPMLQLDDVPTASSNNAVKSGGVAEELALGAVYDVSAKNPTAGPNNDGKWESLSALFSDANLSTLIPASVRKGGMSIKFVQSSDNEYVQFRYRFNYVNTTAGNNRFINPNNWQGIEEKPIALSKNFVESGGVSEELSQTNIIQQYLYRLIISYHEKKYPISKDVTVVSLGDSVGSDTVIFDATKITNIKILNAVVSSGNAGIVLADASNNIISTEWNSAEYTASDLTGAKYIYVTTRNKTNTNWSDLSIIINGIFLSARDMSEYMVSLGDSFNIRDVENGGLNGVTGQETSTPDRCRTKFIKVNGFFGVLSKVPCNIFLYDETKQFISHTNFSSEPYTATHQGYVRINCDITGKTKDDANVIVAINTAYWDVLLKAQKVERIDNELGYDNLNPIEEGKYINLSGGVGTTAPVSSPTTGSTWQYYLTSISQGNIVRITGRGGEIGAKLWAFLDANNVILSVANPSTIANNEVLTAPQNAAKIVINTLIANASSVECSSKDSLSSEVIQNTDNIKQLLSINTPSIVGTHSSNFIFAVTNTKAASQLIVTSKYTGNAPIFKVIVVRNDDFEISLYQAQVGKSFDYATNILYLPPVFDGFKKIAIVVEVGTSLDINEIRVLEGNVKDAFSPIITHAHLGYLALETANSFKSFEMAGRSGFGACICNPNDDGDGEIWCYHNGNNTIIYNGVKDAYNLKEYTTAQVHSMIQYNYTASGFPLPTFDDFCRICSTYGMKPTLSMGSLTPSLYGKLKHTLTKYGLIEKTTLKNGGFDATTITAAINSLLDLYAIFGDSITYELYGEVCNTSVVDEFYSANFGNARKVIEPYANSIDALSSSAQKEWCDYVISKGIVLSLIAGSDSTLDYEKYLKLGFIEFNTDTLPKMYY